MQTHIVKWGNSHGIRLPKTLLDSVNMSGNDAIEVIVENDCIIIKKAASKKNMSIEERFKDYNGEYEPVAVDWGDPAGKEIW